MSPWPIYLFSWIATLAQGLVHKDLQGSTTLWLSGGLCSPCLRVAIEREGKGMSFAEREVDGWYVDSERVREKTWGRNWERVMIRMEDKAVWVEIQDWMQPKDTTFTLNWRFPCLRVSLYVDETVETIDEESVFWENRSEFKCAENCFEACSGPSPQDCTGLLAFSLQTALISTNNVMEKNWTVSWWVHSLSVNTIYVHIQTLGCLEEDKQHCTRLYIQTDELARIRLCEFTEKTTQCSESFSILAWAQVSLSHCGNQLAMCIGGTHCAQLPTKIAIIARELIQQVHPALQGRELTWKCLLWTQKRTLLDLGPPRSLPTASHFAGWTQRQRILPNEVHYYTFVNTHLTTKKITVSVTGPGFKTSAPRLYVYKPFGSVPDWTDTAGGPKGNLKIEITPKDAQVVVKGGSMTGPYTVKVTNPNPATYTYGLNVLIECQETSGACFCPTGSYPDPDTVTCSACSAGDNSCLHISEIGCVSVTRNISPAVGGFNCQPCYPPTDFLTQGGGDCKSCNAVCATCSDTGSAGCLSCAYPNTELRTPPGPSDCVCIPGTYPNPTISTCASCNITCLACLNATPTKCTSCKANASLSGPSPNSCVCNPGFLGSSDSCISCDPTCGTCLTPAVTSCLTCKTHAALVGSICQCVAGYVGTADDCYLTCHPECLTCVGSTNVRCMSCQPTIARLNGTSPNSCVCSNGYYGTPPNCSLCDTTCLQCAGAGSGQCTVCKTSAITASSFPGICTCDSGFFPLPDPSNCQSCNSACLLCSGPNPNQCTNCHSNGMLLNGVNPGSCVCASGFYTDSDAANCRPCEGSCSECSGGTADLCTSCKLNAALSGPSPTTCVCASGFSLDTASFTCQICDLSCLHCAGLGPFACTACYPNSILLSESGPGSCECQPGYYAVLSAQTCSQCHHTCRSCRNSSTSGCLDCYDFANMSGSACVCIDKAYPDPDSASCRPCYSTCRSCLSAQPSSCLSCETGGYLLGPAPSACICSPNFYPSPDASLCVPCLQDCRGCVNAVTCLNCRINAVLNKESLCECTPGSFGMPDASNCVKCTDNCQFCYELGCRNCLLGYYLLDFACFKECPIGYIGTSEYICAAADMSPPIPTLTVLGNNTLSIAFDQSMNFTLSSTDFVIDVITPSGDLSPVTWSEPEFQTSSNFTVYLTFQSSYLPPYSEANFTFLSPSQVLSSQLVPTTTLWLIAILHSFGPQPANQTNLQSGTTAKQAAATARGVLATSAVTSLVSGPSGFLALVNQLQLITYLSMTKIPISNGFAGTLAALNVGNMLPSPLKIDKTTDITEAVSPPAYVTNYGIDTVLFLTNAATFLGISSLLLASYIPTYFLAKSSHPKVAAYCQTRMKSLLFSTPLRSFFTSYLDLCVFSLLQLTKLPESLANPYALVSLLAAGAFALLTCVAPIALVVFTVANRSKMMQRSDAQFNERWGALYLNFAQTDKAAILAFYSLFLIRRLVLAAMLVLLPSQTALFAVINCSFSIISLLYLLLCRPYEVTFDHIEAVSIEAGTAFIYLFACSYAFPLTEAIQSALDVVGIWAVRALIAVSSLFSLFRSGAAVWRVVKTYKSLVKAKYEVRGQETISTREIIW